LVKFRLGLNSCWLTAIIVFMVLFAFNSIVHADCFTQEQLDDAVASERKKWDIREDGKIGLEEAIRALQVAAGIQEDISHPNMETGVISVSGTGEDTYEVFDSTGTGTLMASAETNEDIMLSPGDYTVFLNESVQTVTVQAGKKEILTAGVVSVAGIGDDKYYVYDETGTGDYLAYAKLNEEIELFPDIYVLGLNNSRQSVAVEAGEKSVPVPGSVIVSGTGQDLFYVYNDDLSGDSLAYAKTNQDINLFPGDYIASINDTTETATVKAGEKTILTAGTVSVSGTGADDFYIHDTFGKQLDYTDINKEIEVFSGDYTVSVNKTVHPATVESGQKTVLTAGSISVSGTGTDDFYVYDTAGTQLDYTDTNKVIEVFAGTYTVSLNDTRQTATVQGSEKITLEAGRLIVSGSTPTSTLYYVYDSEGRQLDSTYVNRETELFPSSYIVSLNDTTQTASIQAGEETLLVSGTLSVSSLSTSGNTLFYVYDDARNELDHAITNKEVELFSGTYTVSLNDTQATATVQPGEKTVVEAGTVSVSSISTTGNARFYVYDDAWSDLDYAYTNKEVELFPGTYKVSLNDTRTTATVQPGEKTVLESGTVSVSSISITGNARFYVHDDAWNDLGDAYTNKEVELFPGSYTVSLNDTQATATVQPGKKTVLESGTVSVSSISTSGNIRFYVRDAWNDLGYAYTNKEVEVFPGIYTVSLNDTHATAIVQAGEISALPSGVLTISGTGSSYYDIYDADGNKLIHAYGEKAIELFPGTYTVVRDDDNLSAEVEGGQNMIVDF